MPYTKAQTTTGAREALHKAYLPWLQVNTDLDRSLVSFQANKNEPFYRWFKYKEGFSSALVCYCLEKLAGKRGVLLDPFAGAGAALFASRDAGWDAAGIEMLPVGFYAIEARLCAESVSPRALAAALETARKVPFGDWRDPRYAFRHIAITRGAFDAEAEDGIAGYLAYCDGHIDDPSIRKLFQFACFCVLEEISFTRKDGQYLRWDCRSGRDRSRSGFDKGRVVPFGEAVVSKLDRIAQDIPAIRKAWRSLARNRGTLDIRKGSCLGILPDMPPDSVDFVLTSPPYCNRYDYTRTYALELAFLGCTEAKVKELRQAMLSCTVENKGKAEQLRQIYEGVGRLGTSQQVGRVFDSQEALHEVLEILESYREAGGLNNNGIPRMVRNYFYEMCFVLCELARVLRPGGSIVMVNDNVRYAGETVPVDLILSDFATKFGLEVKHIWALPRGKGNSSQQMGCHGREELRKGVYVWQKPR